MFSMVTCMPARSRSVTKKKGGGGWQGIQERLVFKDKAPKDSVN